VTLAALPPAALTTGCEVLQKSFELSGVAKETLFFNAMDKKARSKRLETFSNKTITVKCETQFQNKKITSEARP